MSKVGKPARNFPPRTIWTGDNLDILRAMLWRTSRVRLLRSKA